MNFYHLPPHQSNKKVNKVANKICESNESSDRSLTDSLSNIINNGTNDSVRYYASWAIINSGAINRDTALHVIEQALTLAWKNNKKLQEARALIYKGQILSINGRYAESLTCLPEAFTIAENLECENNTWVFEDKTSFTLFRQEGEK